MQSIQMPSRPLRKPSIAYESERTQYAANTAELTYRNHRYGELFANPLSFLRFPLEQWR